jgi:hemerythrin-like metal-binding protein
MASIEWRPEFSTGVPEVDHEHRELIGWINRALVAAAPAASPRAVAVELLGEIYAKISAHFALEERVMRELGYVHLAEHKQDHERLLDDILDIMDDYEAGDAGRFASRLSDWFGGHFRTHDARFHLGAPAA